MCGRYTLRAGTDAILIEFGIRGVPDLDLKPRYNIAPMQEALAVPNIEPRQVSVFRFGMVLPFLEKPTGLINVRAETIAKKSYFASALRTRRCLVVADGFYEWKREGGRARPFFFRFRDNRVFAFAGIFAPLKEEEGEGRGFSFAIITTSPCAEVSGVHERMPVIMPREGYDVWLSSGRVENEKLLSFLRPLQDGLLESYEVSSRVNSAKNEGLQCLEPAKPQSLF
jgi:putative SOS response-associated peptidase YedK